MAERSGVDQNIPGTDNTQINSGEDTIVATSQGAMAAKGNISIINQGIDPKEYAQLLAEKIILEGKLSQIRNEKNDVAEILKVAMEASKLAEEMQKNESVEISADKYIELGNASRLAGRLEVSEGQYKQALRTFALKGDKKGKARHWANSASSQTYEAILRRQNACIKKV